MSLAGGICWGFSGACGEYLLQHTSVSLMYLSWFRFMLAAPCFALLIVFKDRKRFVQMITDVRSIRKLIIYTICGLVACQLVYMASIRVTNAGTATVLQCLEIVMIIAWTSFVYHKAPSKRDVAGFILAFLSVFIIATHGDPTQLVLPIAGIILGLLNAVFASVLTIYPKELLARWGNICTVGTASIMGAILLTMIAQPWNTVVELDAQGWLCMVYMAIIGTFLAFVFYFQGVKDLGPVKSALLATIEPISATLFSWAWLGTSFPPIDLVGFGLMIAMIVLVTKVPKKNDTQEKNSPVEA